MANNEGLVANIKDKLLKKQDGSKSPPVPQHDPQKRKLGDEDDGPAFKLDLLRILDEQANTNEAATLQLLSKDKEHYKVLLAEHGQTTTNATNQTLSSFAQATQKQFEIVDTRLDHVERDVETCKASNDELQRTVATLQAEQQRLASALVLADRHGSVTRQDTEADEFDRPNNQEIIIKYILLARRS